MCTCDRFLPFFVLLIAALTAIPAGALPPTPGDVCGEDYFFRLEGPAGWQAERHAGSDGVSIVYTAQAESSQQSPIAMAITLPREQGKSARVDLNQVLAARVATLALYGDPRVIRDESTTHTSLATRSAVLELPAGELHISVIDAQSGHGDYFVVSLVKEGGAATPAELGVFKDTINSLAFDPTRACEGAGAQARTIKRATAFPASPDPAAETSEPPTNEIDAALVRAFSGCHAMQKMLVPVNCRQATVAGEPALVMTFSDGSEPADVYLERFRDRIAGTYCWARSLGALPPLYLHSRGNAAPPSRLREYSCATQDWGRSHSPASLAD